MLLSLSVWPLRVNFWQDWWNGFLRIRSIHKCNVGQPGPISNHQTQSHSSAIKYKTEMMLSIRWRITLLHLLKQQTHTLNCIQSESSRRESREWLLIPTEFACDRPVMVCERVSLSDKTLYSVFMVCLLPRCFLGRKGIQDIHGRGAFPKWRAIEKHTNSGAGKRTSHSIFVILTPS